MKVARGSGRLSAVRNPLAIVVAVTVLAVPVAIADNGALTSVSSKQFKKLKKQVKQLDKKLDKVDKEEGPQGPAGADGAPGADGSDGDDGIAFSSGRQAMNFGEQDTVLTVGSLTLKTDCVLNDMAGTVERLKVTISSADADTLFTLGGQSTTMFGPGDLTLNGAQSASEIGASQSFYASTPDGDQIRGIIDSAVNTGQAGNDCIYDLVVFA